MIKFYLFLVLIICSSSLFAQQSHQFFYTDESDFLEISDDGLYAVIGNSTQALVYDLKNNELKANLFTKKEYEILSEVTKTKTTIQVDHQRNFKIDRVILVPNSSFLYVKGSDYNGPNGFILDYATGDLRGRGMKPSGGWIYRCGDYLVVAGDYGYDFKANYQTFVDRKWIFDGPMGGQIIPEMSNRYFWGNKSYAYSYDKAESYEGFPDKDRSYELYSIASHSVIDVKSFGLNKGLILSQADWLIAEMEDDNYLLFNPKTQEKYSFQTALSISTFEFHESTKSMVLTNSEFQTEVWQLENQEINKMYEVDMSSKSFCAPKINSSSNHVLFYNECQLLQLDLTTFELTIYHNFKEPAREQKQKQQDEQEQYEYQIINSDITNFLDLSDDGSTAILGNTTQLLVYDLKEGKALANTFSESNFRPYSKKLNQSINVSVSNDIDLTMNKPYMVPNSSYVYVSGRNIGYEEFVFNYATGKWTDPGERESNVPDRYGNYLVSYADYQRSVSTLVDGKWSYGFPPGNKFFPKVDIDQKFNGSRSYGLVYASDEWQDEFPDKKRATLLIDAETHTTINCKALVGPHKGIQFTQGDWCLAYYGNEQYRLFNPKTLEKHDFTSDIGSRIVQFHEPSQTMIIIGYPYKTELWKIENGKLIKRLVCDGEYCNPKTVNNLDYLLLYKNSQLIKIDFQNYKEQVLKDFSWEASEEQIAVVKKAEEQEVLAAKAEEEEKKKQEQALIAQAKFKEEQELELAKTKAEIDTTIFVNPATISDPVPFPKDFAQHPIYIYRQLNILKHRPMSKLRNIGLNFPCVIQILGLDITTKLNLDSIKEDMKSPSSTLNKLIK